LTPEQFARLSDAFTPEEIEGGRGERAVSDGADR
jgi:hypothetical protein